MTEIKEKKPVTKKTRVTRIPHLEVGKEVVVELVNGTFVFNATQTMTIDANAYVHIGRIRVPSGYALILHGTRLMEKKLLIVSSTSAVGAAQLGVFCTNTSPELRRIYAGEAVAMGVLVKISDNAVVNKFD